MNLKEIRQAVLDAVDWAPTSSSDALDRVNRFVNRAYMTLAEDAPFLFFEDIVQIVTPPDETAPTLDSTVILDKLNVAADPHILVRTELNATFNGVTNGRVWPTSVFDATLDAAVLSVDDAGVTGGFGRTTNSTDDFPRTWDGRMLEVTDGNDVKHRHRIRTIFDTSITIDGSASDQTGGTGAAQHLVLFEPFEWQGTNTRMDYRVYTDAYYLPDDVIEVRSMQVRDISTWVVDGETQSEAESNFWDDTRSNVSSGIPRYFYRRPHVQIPAPTRSPTVKAASVKPSLAPWKGPEPPGTFVYVYTYCWGKRDPAYRDTTAHRSPFETFQAAASAAPDVVQDPLWESAPSPAASDTNVITDAVVADGSTEKQAGWLELDFLNVHYMQGFWDAAAPVAADSTRAGRSGWYIRVYRKRTATTTGTAAASGSRDIVDEIETASSVYYLLAEIDGKGGTYYDDATIVPDYHRRLRTVNGYQAVAFYPVPDARYVVDVRCVRRPQPLVNPQDAPRIHLDAAEVLIQRALTYMYEHLNNNELALLAERRYRERLAVLTRRYGSAAPASQVIMRKPARASGSVRRRSGRKWYSTG